MRRLNHNLILPAVLIALTLWVLLSLGFWQLERADEKRRIENQVIKAQHSPVKIVTQVDEILDKEYYQVLLEGRYDSGKQFIYDNQIVQGNAGYYVLTPFVLANKTAILVNRGFVPWHGNRDKLVDIDIENNKSVIKVSLIKPKQRIELKQQNLSTSFPMLIQSLDLTRLSQLADYQFMPMLAQLDVQADNGFYRKWQPFYGSVDKHLGYALQWFLMAFVLFLIAARLLFKSK